MLEYENQLFLDLLHEDSLLILAKGLGIERLFQSLLRCYGEGGQSGNLVLVLGTRDQEEEYFLQQNAGEASLRVVNSEISTSERGSMYRNGGIYFVSTRILTVDLLTERLPPALISGILVYRAHISADSAQETFVLRLYRQKNKSGFIKAFSDAPNYFRAGGFRKTERIMRNLFVRNLILCPRFQVDVCAALEKNPPEVIELHLSMTQDMLTLQSAILDLMDFTLKEIRRLNPNLASGEPGEGEGESQNNLSLEAAISKSFIKSLTRECDPIWHRLSWKTKTLIQDLKTLRTLMVFLAQYDAVTFHGLVSALKTTENAMKTGGWMLLDAAETLFLTSESRVTKGASHPSSGPKKAKSSKMHIEENPKWLALSEVISEIKQEIPREPLFPTEKILILVSDTRTARQLEEYLAIGAQALLKKLFNKSVALTEKFGKLEEDDDGQLQDPHPSFRKGKAGKKSSKPDNTKDEPKEMNFVESPLIVVQSLQVDPFERFRLLNELKPRYVIMYDVDLVTVRQLEVFTANEGPSFKIRVYFMFYGKSTEEQSFLTTIRTEKEAFEGLIREKANMVIPEDREGRSEVPFNADLLRGSDKASDAIVSGGKGGSSRQGGGSANAELPGASSRIIVDMREFRCELPSLIHKRGIDIEPITLEVGDYILTPDICVERKSISDLIGSLNSGRLYTQATSMTRFYAKPMLLIEFDRNKPFALQGRYYMSRDVASSDVVLRLQLLTLHFPKLIILWSPSPHATAEIFEELKKGREEPSADRAAAISIDIADEFRTERFHPAVFDFVSKLPGVTAKSVYAIMNSVGNLGELLEMSEGGLADIVESKTHGKLLYEALHCKMEPPTNEAVETKKTSRFKHRIKKK